MTLSWKREKTVKLLNFSNRLLEKRKHCQSNAPFYDVRSCQNKLQCMILS
jgi:hypothetical protein